MRFKNHYDVDGRHAFLGASKHHWVNYDLDKMEKIWENKFKSEKGTRLHKLAAFCIKERVKLQENGSTLSRYVNDSIGFKMTPEQPLVFSDDVFGTPDAISFRKQILRVHDLKTGEHPGHPDQVHIYFALFCLEYPEFKPYDIEMIGRIYQYNAFTEFVADPAWITEIMGRARNFDRRIQEMKEVML